MYLSNDGQCTEPQTAAYFSVISHCGLRGCYLNLLLHDCYNMQHPSGCNDVWVVLLSCGRQQTYAQPKFKPLNGLTSSLAHFTKLAGSVPIPNLVNRPVGASCQYGDLSPFCDFCSYFFLVFHHHSHSPDHPIIAVDDSNDVFLCKEVPFVHFTHRSRVSGSSAPKSGELTLKKEVFS